MLVTALLAACCGLASAHVTVNPRVIEPAGSYFRVAMRAPHGCGEGEGDDRVYYPMEKIEVTVPAEIAAESTARGEWIAGWRSSRHEQVRHRALALRARVAGWRAGRAVKACAVRFCTSVPGGLLSATASMQRARAVFRARQRPKALDAPSIVPGSCLHVCLCAGRAPRSVLCVDRWLYFVPSAVRSATSLPMQEDGSLLLRWKGDKPLSPDNFMEFGITMKVRRTACPCALAPHIWCMQTSREASARPYSSRTAPDHRFTVCVSAQVPPQEGNMTGWGFPSTQFCIREDGSKIRTDWIDEDEPTLEYKDPCDCGESMHH